MLVEKNLATSTDGFERKKRVRGEIWMALPDEMYGRMT